MSIFRTALKKVIVARERQAERDVARLFGGMEDMFPKTIAKSREGLTNGPF